MKLTAKLERVLLNPSGWLTDEHVDAAERLLKSERDGIGGLNDIVAMTHFDKKTKVDLATKALRQYNATISEATGLFQHL